MIARRAMRSAVAAAIAAVALAGPLIAADYTARDLTKMLFGAEAGAAPDLSGKDLNGLDLAGLDFKHARLAKANLFGADLSGSDLSGTDMKGAVLDRSSIIGAKFDAADLEGASILRPNSFSGMTASAADIAHINAQPPQMCIPRLRTSGQPASDLSRPLRSGILALRLCGLGSSPSCRMRSRSVCSSRPTCSRARRYGREKSGATCAHDSAIVDNGLSTNHAPQLPGRTKSRSGERP